MKRVVVALLLVSAYAGLLACDEKADRVIYRYYPDTVAVHDTTVVPPDTVYLSEPGEMKLTVRGKEGSKVFVNGQHVGFAPVVIVSDCPVELDIEVRQNR